MSNEKVFKECLRIFGDETKDYSEDDNNKKLCDIILRRNYSGTSFAITGKRNYFNVLFSKDQKEHPMKTKIKTILTMNKPTLLRNLALTILFMATFIATLFLLINSPA